MILIKNKIIPKVPIFIIYNNKKAMMDDFMMMRALCSISIVTALVPEILSGKKLKR